METMETAAAQALLTPEEYLARERKALTKSEYRNGQIYAMPGASRKHNLITVYKTAFALNTIYDRSTRGI